MEPATWAMVSGVASPSGTTEFHYVSKIYPFPGMVRTGGLWTGDAVLLRLDRPLVFRPNTQPVCVPDAPPRSTARCVVAGWTRSTDGMLATKSVRVILCLTLVIFFLYNSKFYLLLYSEIYKPEASV